MTCSVMKVLDMLRQLQSSPELSPLQHSSVHTLSVALELFAWMENELAAIDTELTSVAAFLASAEAGYLSAEVLESKLQVVATVERAMPNADSALGDLWEVGPFLWSSVSTISSWLPVDQEFLQADDIPREMTRLRLRIHNVVHEVGDIRKMLESLGAMASLGEAIGAIDLES